MDPSLAIVEYVGRRSAELEAFSSEIMRCRVMIEDPQRHHRRGRRYHVRIDLTVHDGELIAGRDSATLIDDDVYACVDEAFSDAKRLLLDYVRCRRGDKQRREATEGGQVARLFPYEELSYGIC